MLPLQDLSSELHTLKEDLALNKSALQSALALASEERESSRMREEDNEIRYERRTYLFTFFVCVFYLHGGIEDK